MSNQMIMNVLSIRKWELTDEKTGELKSGCTVYVGQDTENQAGNVLGWDIVKFSAPLSVFDFAYSSGKFFPSQCSVEVALKMGSGGKASLSILSIKFAD